MRQLRAVDGVRAHCDIHPALEVIAKEAGRFVSSGAVHYCPAGSSVGNQFFDGNLRARFQETFRTDGDDRALSFGRSPFRHVNSK